MTKQELEKIKSKVILGAVPTLVPCPKCGKHLAFIRQGTSARCDAKGCDFGEMSLVEYWRDMVHATRKDCRSLVEVIERGGKLDG